MPLTDGHALALIDAELHLHTETMLDLSASMAVLKTRRNMLAQISCLPSEVLAQIFNAYAISEHDPHLHGRWVRVTHVCSHWRQVALAYPSLWSHIATSRPYEAREFLLRSKAAPLKVAVDFADLFVDKHAPDTESLTHLVLEELPRIRELEIRVTVSTFQRLDGYLTLLNISAPRLEKLGFHCSPRYSGNLLPTSLLLGCYPALRSLSLSRHWTSWDSPIFHGLSELHLSHIPPMFRPCVSELLSILRSCPALEDLHLEAAGPENDRSASAPSASSVNLPFLRQLNLAMDASSCADLLHRLILPAEVAWTIACPLYPMNLNINPHIVVPRKAHEAMTCKSLCATFSVGHMDVRAWVCSVSRPGLLTQTSLSLGLPGFHFDALGALIEASHWSEATLFRVELINRGGGFGCEAYWSKVLAAVPNLRTLKVINASAIQDAQTEEGLMKALMAPSTSGMLKTYLCPNLSRLKLVKFTFSSCRPSSMEVLQDCLNLRKKHHMPLKELELGECIGLVSEDIQRLKGSVGEVSWDGVEAEEDVVDDQYEQEYYEHIFGL